MAVVNPMRQTVTVGNLGDAEAYVLDVGTRKLAVPTTCFEAHDLQTGEKIEGPYFAAATIPHGFIGTPTFDQDGQVNGFSSDMFPCALENEDPPLCLEDGGMREYNTTREWMGGLRPRLEIVGKNSRVAGMPDPRRSIGEVGGDWTSRFGYQKMPFSKPEIFTWGFNDEEGLQNKWLMLTCDGIYNHDAFRGPKSVCAFLMDPYKFLANELEKSGNRWMGYVMESPLTTNIRERWLAHTAEMRQVAELYPSDSPPIAIQRPLLRTFFDLLYQIEYDLPMLFCGDDEGADAIHQAAIFFMQWTQFGRIGGLATPNPNDDLHPEDLIAALAFLCSMQNSSDNISVSLVNLSA